MALHNGLISRINASFVFTNIGINARATAIQTSHCIEVASCRDCVVRHHFRIQA